MEKKTGEDLPPIHGEVSVEHPLAHLLPLNSPRKFQVRELISQQVRLHETLEEQTRAALESVECAADLQIE